MQFCLQGAKILILLKMGLSTEDTHLRREIKVQNNLLLTKDKSVTQERREMSVESAGGVYAPMHKGLKLQEDRF